jgi:hypothetical protein
MDGESVTVHDRVQSGTDRYGKPVWTDSDQVVSNVLVAIGSSKNVSDSNRPAGVVVAYTLYFPKSYTGELTWKDVTVRGHRCNVIGNPDRWADSPNEWNMEVEVTKTDG